MSRRRHQLASAAFLVAVVACAGIPQRASADTLESALAQAYLNNPLLNAQRALVRATDESVPQALSGYRPRVSATANLSAQTNNVVTRNAPILPLASLPDTTQSGGTHHEALERR